MVDIRVAVEDPGDAHELVQRLSELFDGPSVSFDGARSEVRVQSEWGSRAVVHVIDTVHSWLAMVPAESAKLSFGDRSYTMCDPTRLAGSNELAN